MAIRCPKCHFDNPTDTHFCGNCAAPLHPTGIRGHEPNSPEFGIVSPDLKTETMQTPIKELSTGNTFAGRYQVIEELGKGGMGKVYKVFDTKIKEKIALKLIKPEIASDKETIERFANELKLARKIRHKNVCGMFDIGEAEGAHFITMEYVGGEDLKTMIRMSRRMSIGAAVDIAAQVCEGLAEAHRLGIVHRDLKPSNIMIDREGNARIMDFGIARSLQGKAITGAGVLIGTPEYMSPEQFEGKGVDQRSDIYSLGIILYEMVTGRVPFEGNTPIAIGLKQTRDAPKDPKELNTRVPENLVGLILRCLEKDQKKRYQSAVELHSELEQMTQEGLEKDSSEGFQTPGGSAAALDAVQRGGPDKVIEGTANREELRYLAVLPFRNTSGNPDDEIFCDGLTEDLVTKLSGLSGLRVTGLGSVARYRGMSPDPKLVGGELSVDLIVEGSVRRYRDRVRVSAQLVNAHDGFEIWGDRYDRVLEDVFAIQDDVVRTIALSLQGKLSSETERRILRRPTDSLEAFELCQRGRTLWEVRLERELLQSVGCFRRAIALDPRYALAHAGLSDAYYILAMYGYLPTESTHQLARESAAEAIRLDPNLSDPYHTLGAIHASRDEDELAARAFETAIGLNPNDITAHYWYARTFTEVGNFQRAEAEMEQALRLDPISVLNAWHAAYLKYFSKDSDGVLLYAEKMKGIRSLWAVPHVFLALGYALANQWDEVRQEISLYDQLYKGTYSLFSPFRDELEVRLLLEEGNARAARAVADMCEAFFLRNPNAGYVLVTYHAFEKRHDEAFAWREQLRSLHTHAFRWIRVDPLLSSLDGDPRFERVSQ
jgi:serine/threonine protein kinase